MSNRPFVMLAVASAGIAALPASAAAQDYALPQLEPMPATSQAAPAVQSAAASQLPPVYRAPAYQAPQAPVRAPIQAPVQDLGHRDRGHDSHAGHNGSHGGHNGHHNGHGQPHRKLAYTPEQRDWWISECQRRMSYSYSGYENERRGDDGLGGAAIGGVIGGIAGNRIAGRGDRTKGTIIGAVGGAVVGAAIDKLEDRGSRRGGRGSYDDGGYCENYLAAYESGAFGYGHQGYAVAYAQPMIHRSIEHDHHGSKCGCGHDHHKKHGKKCKKIITKKEIWEEVPHTEVVEEVRYVKQPVKRVRYVKQPTKTTKRYVKQPARSVKSVKSVKSTK